MYSVTKGQDINMNLATILKSVIRAKGRQMCAWFDERKARQMVAAKRALARIVGSGPLAPTCSHLTWAFK